MMQEHRLSRRSRAGGRVAGADSQRTSARVFDDLEPRHLTIIVDALREGLCLPPLAAPPTAPLAAAPPRCPPRWV
jgi:hypothetical protein